MRWTSRRSCSTNIIELQQQAQYTHPDLIPAEYRREIGTLHIAHVMESLIQGESIEPTSTIYTRDYMSVLGVDVAPADLLKDRVMPALMKGLKRMPDSVQKILTKASEAKK
jgi:hypothetical protein